MSPEKTEKLFEEFPILYQGHKKPATENLMSFGFDHGDGWYEPIRKLSAFIEEYNKLHPETPVIAFQVKEKFGTLRFYVEGNAADFSKDLDAAIEQAMKECNNRCEICGTTTGLGLTRGYIQRVCRPCAGSKRGWTPDIEDKTDVRGPTID